MSPESKQEDKREKPKFLTYDEEEIEELIVKLGKKGNSPSEIGLILRDSYGIPSVKNATGKKLGYFLRKNDLQPEIPEDLENLMEQADNLRDHVEKHHKDIHNKRNLKQIESKIRGLAKYYRKEGKIPSDWRYNPEEV